MKSPVIKNTLTNYLNMIVKIMQGIFITRFMIQYLGNELYGMWALLWTIFAYTVLLDFGFGTSAQKYTSTKLYEQNIRNYNAVISSVFTFHLAVSVLILAASACGIFFLGRLFHIDDPEKLSYCRTAYILFACGTALVFPMGIFPEILVGLQMLYLRNYITIIYKIIEIGAVLTLFFMNGKLLSLVIVSMILWFATNLTMALYVPRMIPGFRLSIKLDPAFFKEIFSFSGYVYLNSISRLLLHKTSRLLIGAFCGLEQVGLFHLASRLPELCFSGASQYQENVRPMAASLYAENRRGDLCSMIVNSMRWNMFMGLVFMPSAFIVAPEAISVLFNVRNPEVDLLTRLSLVAMFISLTFQSIPHSIMLMTERHRRLSVIILTGALVNLALNICTLPFVGTKCIPINSSIVLFLMAGIGMLPEILKLCTGFSTAKFFYEVFLLPAMLAVPGCLIAVFIRMKWKQSLGDFGTAALCASLCSGIFILLCVFLMLKKEERETAFERMKSFLQLRKA